MASRFMVKADSITSFDSSTKCFFWIFNNDFIDKTFYELISMKKPRFNLSFSIYLTMLIVIWHQVKHKPLDSRPSWCQMNHDHPP